MFKNFSPQCRRVSLQIQRGNVRNRDQLAYQIGGGGQSGVPLLSRRLQTREQVQALPVQVWSQVSVRQARHHFFAARKLFQAEISLAQEQMATNDQFVVQAVLRCLLERPFRLAEQFDGALQIAQSETRMGLSQTRVQAAGGVGEFA